jgi:hypothetical protein
MPRKARIIITPEILKMTERHLKNENMTIKDVAEIVDLSYKSVWRIHRKMYETENNTQRGAETQSILPSVRILKPVDIVSKNNVRLSQRYDPF